MCLCTAADDSLLLPPDSRFGGCKGRRGWYVFVFALDILGQLALSLCSLISFLMGSLDLFLFHRLDLF